jgi:hypothetical protein
MLFEYPIETAKGVAGHLGAIDADVDANAANMQGRYAKDMSRSFSDEDRRIRDADDRVRLKDEIATARTWLETSKVVARLPGKLPRPLVGEAPALLG